MHRDRERGRARTEMLGFGFEQHVLHDRDAGALRVADAPGALLQHVGELRYWPGAK